MIALANLARSACDAFNGGDYWQRPLERVKVSARKGHESIPI